MIRFLTTISILIVLTSCGFKPMYKLSDSSFDFRSYSITIMNENDTSREIKEEIIKSFPSSSEIKKEYDIEINTNENLEPLITNTDGTIAKYRIEIIMNFKVKDKNENTYIIEDTVRGFARYSVETSEIESDDKKKRMIKTATSSAIQMMISKIQSDTSITNDN
ncbi:hypothetical protein OBA27_01360 [Pelagibacteraceae bacterium]|nr:hypothetical protein [Pelagibacteraceae bacterium]